MRMINLHTLSLSLLCLILVSCQAEPKDSNQTQESKPISEAMLGTWELIELEVSQVSIDGLDSNHHRLIQEADWIRLYGVSPGRTTFSADGKFIRRNKLVGSEEPTLTHGLWEILGTGDSIRVIEPNILQVFQASLNETQDQFEWAGMVDYDGDQAKDDSYREKYRLVGRTVEAEE